MRQRALRRRYGRARYGLSVLQSITTKFIGPSNVRGSRIKATSTSGKSVIVSYDHALDSEENHHRAAKMLAHKLGWKGRMVAGSASGGKGNVYVFVDGSDVIDLGNE